MCDRGLHKGDRDQAALRRRLFSPRHRVLRQGATTIAPSRIWPTLHVKGYSAPETKAAAERAHLLIEQDKPFGPAEVWGPICLFLSRKGKAPATAAVSVSWACAESVAKRRKLLASGPDRKHLPGKHVKHSVELVRRAVDERNCRQVASKATRKRSPPRGRFRALRQFPINLRAVSPAVRGVRLNCAPATKRGKTMNPRSIGRWPHDALPSSLTIKPEKERICATGISFGRNNGLASARHFTISGRAKTPSITILFVPAGLTETVTISSEANLKPCNRYHNASRVFPEPVSPRQQNNAIFLLEHRRMQSKCVTEPVEQMEAKTLPERRKRITEVEV